MRITKCRAKLLSFVENDPLRNHVKLAICGVFASMLGIILYYIYAFAALKNGSVDFDWLLGIFSDFVAIMNDSLNSDPYVVGGTSYPPIAILVLYPFSLICKKVLLLYSGQALTIDELTSRVILHREFWVAIVLFFLVNIIGVIWLLSYKYKFNARKTLNIALLIVSSAPFIYIIMRGNTIYVALLFLLVFLSFYESSNALLREIAYISLVLSGGIKIYPLLYGVFLLNKKKFFPALRVAVYSVMLFLVSFALYGFDLNDISQFIKNLSSFASDANRMYAANNLSLSSLLYKWLSLFASKELFKELFSVLNPIFLGLAFIFAAFSSIFTRSSFSRSLITTCAIVLIPQVSYFYVLSFMIIPFAEFIQCHKSIDIRKRRFYNFAFTFLFFTPLIMTKNFFIHSLIVSAMFVVEIYSFIKEKKREKALLSNN